MRRLARHLFTLCSAVSLLLCVAMCALWARSYDWPQVHEFTFGGARWEAWSRRGVLSIDNQPQLRREFSAHLMAIEAAMLRYSEQQRAAGMRLGISLSEWQAAKAEERQRAAELASVRARPAMLSTARNYAVNHAAAAGVLAVPSAGYTLLLLARRRLRERLSRGLCASCGYDLRASPDRCPECGTPAK